MPETDLLKLVRELLTAGQSQAEQAQSAVEELVNKSLKNLGLATKDDIARLEARIEALAASMPATEAPAVSSSTATGADDPAPAGAAQPAVKAARAAKAGKATKVAKATKPAAKAGKPAAKAGKATATKAAKTSKATKASKAAKATPPPDAPAGGGGPAA